MAKWTFDPVAADEWAELADEIFWKRFSRQNPSRQSQMLTMQLAVLSSDDATELAEMFASDDDADKLVRDVVFEFLIERAAGDGRAEEAAGHSVRNAQVTGGNRRLITSTILTHGSADQATTAATALRDWLDKKEWASDEVLVGLLLDKAGVVEARAVADRALDKVAAQYPHMRFAGVNHSVGSRMLDRKLFRLARRGGQVRMAGLLNSDGSLTPATLSERLAGHVYFDEATIETTDDRVLVDLDEFSLDFRFTDDAEHVRHAQRTYDSFPHENRRFIPPPPSNATRALLVVAIGDDLSLPDVVNPMIELSVLLEDFGECVFLIRVGPLSRNTEYSNAVEPIDAKAFDKLVRARITPLVKEAGFGRRTTRRFDFSGGSRGLHVLIAIGFYPDQRHRVIGHMAMYYTDDLDPKWLDRYRNKKGEFTPKSQLVTPHLHHSATFDTVPRDPGAESVASVVDELAELIEKDWLPLVDEANR